MRGAAAFVDRGRRTTHKCYNLYFTVEMLTARDGLPKPDMVENRDFTPRVSSSHIAISFGTEKLEWCGYTIVK